MSAIDNKNQQRTRIVHLLPGLKIGGCERLVLNLHHFLNMARFDSSILYWDPDPEMLKTPYFKPLQSKTHRLDMPKVISFASIDAICDFLRQAKAGLLHTHLMDADLLGFFAAKRLGLPHIVTIHSYPYPLKFTHCIRYKIMTMLSTHIVCVSETVKRHVLKTTRIHHSKISTICSGINLSSYPAVLGESERRELRGSCGIPDDSFVVGYVSRIAVDKGHEYLFAGVSRVLAQCNNAHFLIVGDGDRREHFMEQISRQGLEKNVSFTGSRSDIPELLSLMDVFVYPSLHESFGLSTLEAMAAGLPVVCANSPVIPELISHGEDGIIVPLRDANAIADAIIDLYRNPSKRTAMGLAAREKAEKFSLSRTARSLEDLYLLKINKNSGNRPA